MPISIKMHTGYTLDFCSDSFVALRNQVVLVWLQELFNDGLNHFVQCCLQTAPIPAMEAWNEQFISENMNEVRFVIVFAYFSSGRAHISA